MKPQPKLLQSQLLTYPANSCTYTIVAHRLDTCYRIVGNCRGRKLSQIVLKKIFTEKTFVNSHKTTEFVKFFSLENFPLYSMSLALYVWWFYTCSVQLCGRGLVAVPCVWWWPPKVLHWNLRDLPWVFGLMRRNYQRVGRISIKTIICKLWNLAQLHSLSVMLLCITYIRCWR